MTKLFIILIHVFVLACSTNGNLFDKRLCLDQFPGFSFSKSSDNGRPALSGYKYQPIKGEKIIVHNCEQASNIDISKIADYDYFRFKLLLVSCIAVDKYSTAGEAHSNHFPRKLDANFIYQLPAAIIPLLSQAEAIKRQDRTVKSYDAGTQVTVEKENTFKLLTEEDEVYLRLLARGDFTKDGFEDLLVQSEWYARNAHGKHTDLLILSKTGNDSPVEINWRLNK